MSRIFITASFFLFCCLSASAENLVANSGFEEGGWQEHLSSSAKAAGRIDKSTSHSGKASFKMTNASPFGPNVYYRIFQPQQVKPNTKYLIGVWSKGQEAGKCWIGGGPVGNWCLKKQLPVGTFDWTWSSVEYTTGPDQTMFELMIVTESETKSLWVDDVYFAPVKSTAEPVVYQARVKRGLTGDLRFYPALPVAAKDESPAVRVRDAADPTLGCNIKINWDKANLYLTIDVLDPTAGPVVPGVDMWYNDSIQLGIDTQPEVPKDGYKASCVELGFGLLPNGKVTQYAWHTGGLDQYRWKDLPAEGNRTPTGYQLRITAPWTQLGVNLDRLPTMIAVNVAVNDGQVPPKGRRYVEWTYGICAGPKTPDQFARVVLIDDPKAKSGAAIVFTGKTRFDIQDFMIGRYIEYAFKNVPAEPLVLTYAKTDGSREEEWVKTSLPAIQTGSIREFEFLLPAARLSEEGKYLLSVRSDSTGTGIKSKGQVIRENTSVRVAQLLAQSKSRTAELRKLFQNNPKLAANAYVKLGLTLADRFIKRVQTGGPLEKKQSLDWSLLQLNQLAWVLDQTENFVKNPIFDSPKPTNGPVTIRNGVFYTDTTWGQRPFFFNGFGHFGSAVGDSPIFPDMGYTLIQHSRAPCEMSGEGQIWEPNRKAIVDIMKLTTDHKVKIDLLLAPHYFPEWAVAQDPEVLQPLYNGGWNKFNVNHPVARDAVGRFIDAIVPLTKDFPSLFSYCLMNEPSYGLSGRDKYSKPLWIEFLTKRHGSIQTLNSLYGTKYASFEQVPVPAAEGKTVNERRAYLDWRDFNAQNFAEWHRFMHERIKKNAPQAFTHSKILDWLFDPAPELISEVTDLAGNDVWALYTGGEYAFNWLQMEMWYDLLHSFKNQPVINSENHILPDSSTVGDDFPAVHTAAVLWQETLHHQGASEIWVWEEPVQGNLEGHMMLRPANTYAGGKALLEINRLAGEVAAINQAEPQVAILHVLTASFWEKDVEEVNKAVYAALNFMGLKITFVSERQLAAGKLPKCKCLVVPHATHVSSSTVDALQTFVKGGGTLVFVGNDNLAFDQYHRRRTLPDGLAKTPVVTPKAVVSALREIPSLKQVGLVDLLTGQPAWGVEYRVVPYQGQLLVPMMNMLSKPQTVRLAQKGRTVDLITGRSVDLDRLVLEPMVPHLFQIGN